MKKLLLSMFLLVLLVGTVSAFEWDNVKRYDEETKTVTVVNALGLGEDIAEVKLNTPLIYKVGYGAYTKVAEFEVTNYENYTNVFNSMEFYDLNKNSERFTRDFDYKQKIIAKVPDYKTVCDMGFTKNGTKINTNCRQEQVGLKDKVVWKDIDKSEGLIKGNITIGIFTFVERGDHVEWIPNFFGIRINEWAEWTASLNVDLLSYLTLDETSGTANDSTPNGNDATLVNGVTQGLAGKIGNAYHFSAGSSQYLSDNNHPAIDDTVGAVSFWVNNTNQDANQGWLAVGDASGTVPYLWIGHRNVGDGRIELGGFNDSTQQFSGLQTTEDVMTVNTWYHIVVTANSTHTEVWINADKQTKNLAGLPDGRWFGHAIVGADTFSYGALNRVSVVIPFEGMLDEIAIWNRTLSQDEIDDLYNGGTGITYTDVFDSSPNITATAPVNAFNTSSQTIIFNVTAEDDINLVNISLYVDGTINQTNSSPINNTLSSFTVLVGDGSHTWSALAWDNRSQSDNSTIFTFTIDSTNPEITVTFPNETFNFHQVNTNLSVNWTVSDLNLDVCILEFEGINRTVTCLDNSTSINITNSVNRSLIFYVNDTSGNGNSSSVSWNYLIFQTSTTFNSSDFQTASQRFTVNATTNGSVITAGSLTFNGAENTGATITNPSGNDYSITNTITIPIVEGSITHNFNLTIIGKVINTTQETIVINTTVLALCNATYTSPFINITFKNETLAEENIAATISSTWVYSLTALAGINKTLTFTNASENANYLFCGIPNRTMNVDIDIDYNNGLSQQRSFASTRTISNVTATEVLYLLPTALGIFSPFKTTNINGDTIAFVSAVITRVLNAQTITVANGLTDSSGFATFFLDPNIAHTATFSRTGFADNVFVFTPSTDLRTVVMGGGGIISNGTIISRGTSWTISPNNLTLPNNTVVSFTFNVTSDQTITLISMNITNSSNSELLFTSNAGVGNLSGTLNTGNNTRLFGNFLIQTADETITVTRTWDVFTAFAGDYSIFRQFTLAKNFGLISEFMRLLIVLAFMAGVLIFMNVGKVIETSESNIAVLLLMTWAFSVVGWLDTGLAVTTTSAGVNRLGEFSNQFGIAILLTIPGLFFILRRLFIRIPR